MKRKDLYFAIGVLVIIGIFVYLSLVGRKAKPMAAVPEHAGITDKTEPQSCFPCHAPDSTVKPMPEHHPKKGRPPDKTNCFVCHKLPAQATALLIPQFIYKPTEEKFIWLNPQQK